MVNTIVIDTLLEQDKDTAREVLVESYKQYKEKFDKIEDYNEYLEQISNSLDNPTIAKVLVAKEQDGNVLGTLQIYLNSSDAYGKPELDINAPIVRLLGVHPNARGKGVARKLIQASIDFARDQRSPHLYLHTGEFMKDAIRLYETYGFKRSYDKDFKVEERNVICYRIDIK